MSACICFQRSEYTARSATQRAALHSTQRYTAPPPTTEPSPSQEKPSAAASGGTAQRSTKHCQCSSDSKRFPRCARLHFLSAQRIYSAQRYTARSATQRAALHSTRRYTAPSASLRPALHCAQRYTVRSIVQPPVNVWGFPPCTGSRGCLAIIVVGVNVGGTRLFFYDTARTFT